MKKILATFAIAVSLVACDNAANTTGDKKDSIDSAANAKKEMIDSSADARKEVIDSTAEQKKEALDKMDSLNKKVDSVSR